MHGLWRVNTWKRNWKFPVNDRHLHPLFMLAWQFPAEMLGSSGLETPVEPMKSPVMSYMPGVTDAGIFTLNRRLKDFFFLFLSFPMNVRKRVFVFLFPKE